MADDVVTTSSVERPTTTAQVAGGRIEYRLEPHGDTSADDATDAGSMATGTSAADGVVLVFHGGHLRAGVALGEQVFADAGYAVLVPSRPGYGRTPLSTGGGSVAGFTDAIRDLCTQLGIRRVAAVVGISGGGPAAVTMAARHADLVDRVVLISAVGGLPWPDRWTRLGGYLAFNAVTEKATWAAVRLLARRAPGTCLRLMLRGLSTRPAAALAGVDEDGRARMLALFRVMRSDRGFTRDLRPVPVHAAGVPHPALVIATPHDGGVPFTHARWLAATIPHATLLESRADTHLVWYAPDWPALADRIRAFLATRPPATPATERPAGRPRPAAAAEPSSSVVSGASGGLLASAFHGRLRAATATLVLAGAVLAAGTAGPAFARLGTGPGLAYLAVAVASVVLAAAVARGVRRALVLAAVVLGGQAAAVVGTVWELAAGIAPVKAHELERLGVPPTLGVVINLAYSATGLALFGWLAWRWRTLRARHRLPGHRPGGA